jgi:hypothetical protein
MPPPPPIPPSSRCQRGEKKKSTTTGKSTATAKEFHIYVNNYKRQALEKNFCKFYNYV